MVRVMTTLDHPRSGRRKRRFGAVYDASYSTIEDLMMGQSMISCVGLDVPNNDLMKGLGQPSVGDRFDSNWTSTIALDERSSAFVLKHDIPSPDAGLKQEWMK